jgi:hypothetical protein
MTLGTCARCPAQAVRTLGMAALCGDCVERILAPIRARVAEYDERDRVRAAWQGYGVQRGVLRPEYGPRDAELACDQCAAEWVGIPGAACWWCWDRNEKLIGWHIEAVLTPPDYDPDDRSYDAVMGAWVDRMAIAIEAGLITREEATRAYERRARRDHEPAA